MGFGPSPVRADGPQRPALRSWYAAGSVEQHGRRLDRGRQSIVPGGPRSLPQSAMSGSTPMRLVLISVFLLGYLIFAFGVRTWLHWRSTGSTGFRGISGKPGSAEW